MSNFIDGIGSQEVEDLSGEIRFDGDAIEREKIEILYGEKSSHMSQEWKILYQISAVFHILK